MFVDTMQAEVIRTYTAKQPDEPSLQVADVVLISQSVDGKLFPTPLFLTHHFIEHICFSCYQLEKM